MTSYNVDPKNQLTSVGTNSCKYDGNGNILTNGVINYVYQDENQLSSVFYPSNSTPQFEKRRGRPLGRGVKRQNAFVLNFSVELLSVAQRSIKSARSNPSFPSIDYGPPRSDPFSHPSGSNAIAEPGSPSGQRPSRHCGTRKRSVPGRVHSVLKNSGSSVPQDRVQPLADSRHGRTAL